MDLAALTTRVSTQFPRWDSEATTEFQTTFFDMLAELCAQYPFHFLRYDPGYYIPTQLPLADSAALTALTHYSTNWVDRGWLHVIPNQERYAISCPALPGQDTANWVGARVGRFNFVKEFTLEGAFKWDFYIRHPDEGFSRVDFTDTKAPMTCVLEHGVNSSDERASWLRFNPIPNDHHLFAISFYASESPTTGSGTGRTNAMMIEYPQTAICLGMLWAAEYFQEARLIDYWNKKLWGDPPSGKTGMTQAHLGAVGRMVKASQRIFAQEEKSVPQFTGGRAAIGRSGHSTGRSRFRGRYFGTNDFT